jgi:hypothetical protein
LIDTNNTQYRRRALAKHRVWKESAPVFFSVETSTNVQASISLVGEASGSWVDSEVNSIESTDVLKLPIDILLHFLAESNLVVRQRRGVCSQSSKGARNKNSGEFDASGNPYKLAT